MEELYLQVAIFLSVLGGLLKLQIENIKNKRQTKKARDVWGGKLDKMHNDIIELKDTHKHQKVKMRLQREIPNFAMKVLAGENSHKQQKAMIGISGIVDVFSMILDFDFELTEKEIYDCFLLQAKKIEHISSNSDCMKAEFKRIFTVFAANVHRIPSDFSNGERAENFKPLCFAFVENIIKKYIECEK